MRRRWGLQWLQPRDQLSNTSAATNHESPQGVVSVIIRPHNWTPHTPRRMSVGHGVSFSYHAKMIAKQFQSFGESTKNQQLWDRLRNVCTVAHRDWPRVHNSGTATGLKRVSFEAQVVSGMLRCLPICICGAQFIPNVYVSIGSPMSVSRDKLSSETLMRTPIALSRCPGLVQRSATMTRWRPALMCG